MQNEETKEIRYADLFGGVGGFRLGLERANPKARCVFYTDIDKYTVQTYNKNFGENWKATDIRTIPTDSIPEIDMLCGGFPCQAFSIAGKRRGFEDTRGTLFFEIARIIEAKKPKIVFLENVKGLLNHEKGKTFGVILQTLSELGYDVQWMVLNSKFFGVPQNRERVFIIGSIREVGRPEVLPFRENAAEVSRISENKGVENRQEKMMFDIYNKKIQEHSPALTEPHHNTIRVITQERKDFREHKTEGTPTLKQRMGTGGNNVPMVNQLGNATYETEKRKFDIEPEKISKYLNEWLEKSGLNKQQVSEKLNLPFTLVEHFFRKSGSISFPDKEIWLKLKDILQFDKTYDKEMLTYEKYITSKFQGNRVYGDGNSPTINSTIVPTIKLQTNTKLGYDEAESRVDGVRLQYPESKTARGRVVKGSSQALQVGGMGGLNDMGQLRKLTPIECERLQGFPDNWTEGCSDTQRYKQMGNAVTVNVIQAIAEKLLERFA